MNAFGPGILGSGRTVRPPINVMGFVNLAGYRYRSATHCTFESARGESEAQVNTVDRGV